MTSKPRLLNSSLVDRLAKAVPLTFVCGMRHTLSVGRSGREHSHNALEIVYHSTGRGAVLMEHDERLPFKDGSVTIIPPKRNHDQVMDTEGEDLCIQVRVPASVRVEQWGCLQIDRIENPVVIREIEFLARSHQQKKGVNQVIFDLRATAVLISLVQSSLASRRNEKTALKETYIDRAESYIAEHFHSIKSVAEVAQAAGISHHHLRHIFKKARGESLVYYLNRVRVDRAKALLTHSRLPLKQVSISSGFKDEYYFSSVFKKFTATSPGSYRNENR